MSSPGGILSVRVHYQTTSSLFSIDEAWFTFYDGRPPGDHGPNSTGALWLRSSRVDCVTVG